ncbi:hypothetical protein EDD85DRAFT_1021912 [Armillaria nabsnona]|nr:hypothetical protein EDD85DRAFT_1021912 [Armillaria nabsnona]
MFDSSHLFTFLCAVVIFLVFGPSAVTYTAHRLVDVLSYRIRQSSEELRSSDLDDLETKLVSLTAQVRSARNALQAVNELPIEILISIFREAQQHLSSFLPVPENNVYDRRSRDWLSLREVCKHWRVVIDTTPTLWSTVDNYIIPSIFLLRSSPAPLSVFFGMRKADFSREDLELLSPHMHRVRALHLRLSEWKTATPTVFETLSASGAAPELVSLTIDTLGTVDAGSHLPALFNGKMPKLRKLCLEYFSTWPSGYFTSLTHVCFHHQPVPQSARPSTSQFLDFLEGCPVLEVLAMVSAGPSRTDEEDVPAPPPDRMVELSSLRELHWGKLSDLTHVKRLLSCLSLPAHTSMYLWTDLTQSDDPAVGIMNGDLSRLLPSDRSNLKNLDHITEWRLSCVPSTMYTIVAVSDGVLYTHGIFSHDHYDKIPSTFPLSEVRTFCIQDQLTNPAMTTALWRDTFQHLPSLVDLRIQPPTTLWTSSRVILGPLKPDNGDAGEGQVMCPLLRSLSIEGPPGAIQAFYISELAKERKRRGSPLESVEVKQLLPPQTDSPEATVPSPFPDNTFVDMISDDEDQLSEHIEHVEYSYDQKSTTFLPPDWPNSVHLWTTSTFSDLKPALGDVSV